MLYFLFFFMKYLSGRAQYEDLYDRIVVEWCRALEANRVPNLVLYIKRAKYAERRPRCIEEWMQRDSEKDEFEKKILTPNCRCNNCNAPMNFLYKSLENWRDKEKYRIIFFYGCPHCKKKRGIYDNWEEEDMTVKCEKCDSQNMEMSSRHKKNGDVQFFEECHDCHHTKKGIFKTHREEKTDPNYERDLKRFYMSPDELDQLKFFVTNAESIFAKREEELAKSKPTPEIKITSPIYHSDPFGSCYFDRI